MMRTAIKGMGLALVIGLTVGGAPASLAASHASFRARSSATCQSLPPGNVHGGACVGTDPNNPFASLNLGAFIFNPAFGFASAGVFFYADKTLPGTSIYANSFGPLGFNFLGADFYLNHGPTYRHDGDDTSVLLDYFLFGFGQPGFHESDAYLFAGQTDYNAVPHRHPAYRVTGFGTSVGAGTPAGGASGGAGAEEFKTPSSCTDSAGADAYAPVVGPVSQGVHNACPAALPDVNGH